MIGPQVDVTHTGRLVITPPNAEFYAERIGSMWGAMCTAYKAKPDTWLHDHWRRSISHLGQLYAAARDGR